MRERSGVLTLRASMTGWPPSGNAMDLLRKGGTGGNDPEGPMRAGPAALPFEDPIARA